MRHSAEELQHRGRHNSPILEEKAPFEWFCVTLPRRDTHFANENGP